MAGVRAAAAVAAADGEVTPENDDGDAGAIASLVDSTTLAQRTLMVFLALHGPQQSKSELSRRLGWTISKSFDVIRRLESRGFLRSSRDATNGRITPIDLTEAGRALANELSSLPAIGDRKGTARRSLNEDYFACGLTPENGYDYGFLLADGSMNRGCNAVRLHLAAYEEHVLEEMRSRFGSDAPIALRKRRIRGKLYDGVTIYFSSRKLCADLLKLGLGPNKDFQDYDLPVVTGATAAAVMRGLFDGDGHHRNRLVRSQVRTATNGSTLGQ